MKSYSSVLRFPAAPQWAERTALSRKRLAQTASLVLLKIPDEALWIVASKTESDLIADPHSYLGEMLRPHSGLITLSNVTSN